MNTLRSLIAVPVLLATLSLAACESSPRRVVVAPVASKLADMVDAKVEFTGELRGPAKLGDFLVVADTPIYLDALSGTGRPGTRVTVAGTLRRFEPPSAADCADGCEHADVPAHYWIEGGTFQAPSVPADP